MPRPVELGRLVRVVAEQRDLGQRRGPAASAPPPCSPARRLAVAEREVGLVRVQPGVLQRVRVELGVQADAPALLAQVEQDSRRRRRSARLPRAAAGRSRTAGCRTRRRSGTRCAAGPAAPTTRARSAAHPSRAAQPEREVLPPVDQAVEGEHPRGAWRSRRRTAAAPTAGVRIVALAAGSGRHQASCSRSGEPRRQRVAQQHHVIELADLGEGGAAVRVPREGAVADEPAGPGVADEERAPPRAGARRPDHR